MHTTLAPLWWPLMELPSIEGNVCAACGRPATDHHHVVWRSAGKLFDAEGREVPKPTVPLCGFGNTSGCHGEAHALKLHFRNNDGRWEFLRLDRPLRYERAIEIEEGWEPCNTY